ncbi:MAG: YidC/Oxa1 family membrane protein insertase [Eubacteriales bacterium]|nr:YidC/Oxa1 family membrane protein insertase [Eubacteriales bacterium]
MDYIVSASLFSPLYQLFGWIIRQLYLLLGNYGLAIVFFTLIVRCLFLPLMVKSNKSMLANQALQPQINELQRIYGKNREAMATAQMELYRENGVSMAGGVLPSLIQLILIWPMYRVVSAPLTYIMNVPTENLQKILDHLKSANILSIAGRPEQVNLPILQSLSQYPQALAHAVNEGLIKSSQMIDINFLGLNLGLVPTLKPSLLFGQERHIYLPLLIIPILTLITAYIPQWLMTRTNPVLMMNREKNKLAKTNPARKAQGHENSQMEAMQKSMKFMPLLSLFFSFTMPAGMGLYIIIGSLAYIASSVISYYIHNKPFADLLLAQERGELSQAQVEAINADLSPRERRKIEKSKLRAERMREMQAQMAEQRSRKK